MANPVHLQIVITLEGFVDLLMIFIDHVKQLKLIIETT